jgi:hypothetical protein
VADHADRRRTPLEDVGRHALERRALLQQPQDRVWLLPDLGEESPAGLARRRLRLDDDFS